MTMLQAIREDLVPVIIVVSLLALYGSMTLSLAGAPDDLRQLVGIVVAFYFAKGAVTTTSREVRQAAAQIASATNGKTGH